MHRIADAIHYLESNSVFVSQLMLLTVKQHNCSARRFQQSRQTWIE
jgi:hypothetical protein